MSFAGHVLWKRNVMGVVCAFATTGTPNTAAEPAAAVEKNFLLEDNIDILNSLKSKYAALIPADNTFKVLSSFLSVCLIVLDA
jgi:hypothetical protein